MNPITQWGRTVLTKKGLQLEAKVHSGTPLRFTKAEVGDGIIEEESAIYEMTRLKSKKRAYPITHIESKQGKSAAVLHIDISNQGLTEGFLLREVGIYAEDPDEGEILYAVRNTGIYAEVMPEESIAEVHIQMQLSIYVGNADNVTILVDDSIIYITRAEFEDLAGKGRTTENVKKNADNIQKLAVEMSVLKNASLNNINENIFIVNFKDLLASEEFEGVWNVTMKRLEV